MTYKPDPVFGITEDADDIIAACTNQFVLQISAREASVWCLEYFAPRTTIKWYQPMGLVYENGY